jgi:SAM-dependent methyltransferase
MEFEVQEMDELTFSRYLSAKRTVDDRALNRQVWRALEEHLSALEGRPRLQVLEVGGGIGTMFQRMVQWGLLDRAEYILIDELAENIAAARSQTAAWAVRQGFTVREAGGELDLERMGSRFEFQAVQADLVDYIRQNPERGWDVLVANAVLDLLDVRKILPLLSSAVRPGGLMYLTINFDGLTALEPVFEPELDDEIIALYHRSMDERSGGSRTGRRLFTWLREAGLRILEAGSSDWAVYPRQGKYPGDEAYFLRYFLHFFEDSLMQRPELASSDLSRWLSARRGQVERGELILIAHQFDFLVEVE